MRIRIVTLACSLASVSLAIACGDDDNQGTRAATGGMGGALTGGVMNSGGMMVAGGMAGAGGAGTGGSATGGVPASGGAPMGGMTGMPMGGMTGMDAGPMEGGSEGGTPMGVTSVAGGRFGPLAGYESSTASGSGLIVRSSDSTSISLQINGLSPNTAYGAHLHALPCSLAGGGHYKIDPAVMDTQEGNELWPAFTTDMDGNALATLDTTHIARADGMSIVIHDPADSAKMLCADLTFTEPAGDVTFTGDLAPFAAAEAGDQSIAGTATLVRTATGTTVTLNVTGLQAGETYAAHVHALPCGVTDAGGHYKIDPAIDTTEQSNELWPAVMPDGAGASMQTFQSTHIARPDAQSVVIHRQTMDAAPKVACADLVRTAPPTFMTTGTATVLVSPDAGLPSLAGTATMTRQTTGETLVSLSITGGAPSVTYPVHVHDRPCGVANGGGHYEFDTSVTDALETNEVWLPITTDAAGAGMSEVTAMSVLRADAQALVVHAEDGARLACFDLM